MGQTTPWGHWQQKFGQNWQNSFAHNRVTLDMRFPSTNTGSSETAVARTEFRTSSTRSTPDNFAKSLLRAAAIIGVDKTTELLAAWKQGAPVLFRKSTVVNGLGSGRPICTTSRHRDCGLAAVTTDELPRLPDRDRMAPSGLPQEEPLCRCKRQPLLHCSVQDRMTRGKTVTTRTKGRVGFDTLCDALSLQANSACFVDLCMDGILTTRLLSVCGTGTIVGGREIRAFDVGGANMAGDW